MKAPAVFALIVMCVLAVVGGVEINKWQRKRAEADDMKSAYHAVLNAYDSSNADTAVSLLSDRTFDHYAGIARQALDANEAQTKALPPHQLTEVLLLRSKATRKQVSGLDGRGVVRLVVGNGWWSSGDVPMRVVDAKVNGSWGELTLVDGEWADAYRDQRTGRLLGGSRRSRALRSREERVPKPVQLVVRMVKEQGSWKVCDAGSGSGVDTFWRGLARLQGVNETELIATSMEAMDEDGKLIAKLWRPMR